MADPDTPPFEIYDTLNQEFGLFPNVDAGTYGSTTKIPQITLTERGLVAQVTEVSVSSSGLDANGNLNISQVDSVLGDDNIVIGRRTVSNVMTADRTILLGRDAGQAGPGDDNLFLGTSAGASAGVAMLSNVFLGDKAGQFATGGSNNVAIGTNAGRTSAAGDQRVAIGSSAGTLNQAQNSVAIGSAAGTSNQAADAVAIGTNAGASSQGADSIAIGNGAGTTNLASGAVAIGYQASDATSSGIRSVAIGYGADAAGAAAIAIGETAQASGTNSVAIGEGAQATTANTVVVNATGLALNPAASGVYVSSVAAGGGTPAEFLSYNATTSEIERYTYSTNANIDHSTVSLVNGTGISATGLGDLTASRTINLADTAVTPGTYGSAAAVPQITIDQQGRITAAVDVPSSSFTLITEDNTTPTGQDVYLSSLPDCEGAYLFTSIPALGTDASGNGRDLTITTGGVLGGFVADVDDGYTPVRGTAVTSGGSTFDLGFTPYVAAYRTLSNFGMSFWYRNSEGSFTVGGGFLPMIDISDGTTNNQLLFTIGASTIQIRVTIGGVVQWDFTTPIVVIGTRWVHLYFYTGAAGGNGIYIGGQPVTPTYAVGSSASTETLVDINAVSTLTSFVFGGQRITLDSLYLWSGAPLTQAQVRLLMLEDTQAVTIADNLVVGVNSGTVLEEPVRITYGGLDNSLVACDINGYLQPTLNRFMQDVNRNLLLGDTMWITYGSGLSNVYITPSQFSVTTTINGSNRVCVGLEAGASGGATVTGSNGVYVGPYAGRFSPLTVSGIGIGLEAGRTAQGNLAIAVGEEAGLSNQGSGSVAIGWRAGQVNQGQNSVAVGLTSFAAFRGVGIGSGARADATASVAIGYGCEADFPNSVVLNGVNATFVPTASGFYVNSVRADPSSSVNTVKFNTTTSEVAYSADSVVEVLAADPAAYTGRMYYNTVSNELRIYDGSVWRVSSTFT